MPEPSAPSIPTKLTTRECEQLNVFSEMNGWQADYQQLGAGKFESSFDLYVSEHLNVTNQRCNREMVVSGVPPGNQVALFMLLNQGDRGVFNGKALEDNEVFIMRNGSEGTLKTPAHLHMINLQIPETRLRDALMTMADCELDHFIPHTHRMTLHKDTIAQLIGISQAVLNKAHASCHPNTPGTRQHKAEELLISTLVTGLTNPHKARGETGRIKRKKCLLLAREYIDSHLDSSLGMETLARESGASLRTLESAFRETYDTTLLRYVKTRRLHAARQRLLQAKGPKTTVTDIALKTGFSHLSYFARDYRKLFGEYPSETLRNSAV